MKKLHFALSLILLLLMVAQPISAETIPELPAVMIEAEPEHTYFQDLYRDFESAMEEQGYVFVDELPRLRNSLSLVWHIGSDDDWRVEEVVLSDYIERPEDAEIPLADRMISVTLKASTTGEPEELWEFENLLTQDLDIEPVDPEDWFEVGMEEQIRLHPIEGTSSALGYTYNMGTLHADDGEFDFHTLDTKLSPLAYEEDTIFDALPKLADYLYESRLRLETEYSTIYIGALITEETPVTEDVFMHSVQWSQNPGSDRSYVRHTIDFDPEISQEDVAAVLTHLEDNLPVDLEIQGLADLWDEASAGSGSAEVLGDGWSARARIFGQQPSFMLNFSIEHP